MEPGGDQPGDVGDVGEKIGPDAAGDLAHAREIDCARVGAGAHRDHPGLLALRSLGELVIVDPAVVLADAILAELIELARKIRGIPVGEMSAVAQIHPEHLVARLQHRGVDRKVRL